MTELLTVKEAAERYKVHEETIRTWVRKGVVPHIRLGVRVIRLRTEDMERVVSPADSQTA